MEGRFIRENKSDAHPSSLIFVDCESLPSPVGMLKDVEDHVFRLGVASYCRLERGKSTREDSIRFRDPKSFWAFVASKIDQRRPVWIWCHNAAADLIWLNLADEMAGDDATLSMNPEADGTPPGMPVPPKNWKGFACLSDPPTMLRLWHRDGGVVNLVDFLNWMPVPLEDVAGWCDHEYVKLPSFKAQEDKWWARCATDVSILKTAVLKLLAWVKSHDLGLFRFTAAAQSLAYWRHTHMTHKIAPHAQADVQALERDAYFGGLADLRHRGEIKARSHCRSAQQLLDLDSPDQISYGPIYELDCNGLYPSLYRTTHVPTILVDWSCPAAGCAPQATTLAEDCVATVLVQPQSDPYPLRLDAGVIYPRGTYWTTLCGVELLRAVRSAEILSVARWSRYETKPALRSYGTACLLNRAEARRNGQPLEERLWKFLANALHGKFGQRPNDWTLVPDKYALDPWDQWCDVSATTKQARMFRSVGYDVQAHGVGSLPSHTFTAIPAFITASAREYMRGLARIAGEYQTLYTCSDALYVTQLGLDRLTAAGKVNPDVPGLLRIAHSGPSADFRGIGWLRLGRLFKRAGVSRQAKLLPGGRVRYSQWAGLEASLWSPLPNRVRVRELERAPPVEWWRGDILHTGWIDRLIVQASAADPPGLGARPPLPTVAR